MLVTALFAVRCRAERARGRAARAAARSGSSRTRSCRSSSGYVLAHYWSLLVIIGQQTVIQLSDPLGNGSNWLGTGGRGIDSRWPTRRSWRCCRSARWWPATCSASCWPTTARCALLPRRNAVLGQLPMLVVMVAYTVGGLSLLFAS